MDAFLKMNETSLILGGFGPKLIRRAAFLIRYRGLYKGKPRSNTARDVFLGEILTLHHGRDFTLTVDGKSEGFGISLISKQSS